MGSNATRSQGQNGGRDVADDEVSEAGAEADEMADLRERGGWDAVVLQFTGRGDGAVSAPDLSDITQHQGSHRGTEGILRGIVW